MQAACVLPSWTVLQCHKHMNNGCIVAKPHLFAKWVCALLPGYGVLGCMQHHCIGCMVFVDA